MASRRTSHHDQVKKQQYTVEGVGRSVQGTPTQAVNRTSRRDKEQPGLGVIIKQFDDAHRKNETRKKKNTFDRRRGIDI